MTRVIGIIFSLAMASAVASIVIAPIARDCGMTCAFLALAGTGVVSLGILIGGFSCR